MKEIISQFNFKKKFGQNFLQDANLLDKIVTLGNVDKDSLVIEVGLGAGALTQRLVKKAGFVLGYEIDKELKNTLDKLLSNVSNIKVIYDDFLNRNLKEDLKEYNFKQIIVVANLPYYITTPIITKFITENINISRIVVMVQNEVANRFAANVGEKNYNSLTVFLNYYFNIKKAFVVSRNAFFPKPNVDSAVVIFETKKHKIKLNNEQHFFKLVRDSFVQKRKTLKNNLKQYDTNLINNVLSKYDKNIGFRAEQITLEEFIDISNKLSENR